MINRAISTHTNFTKRIVTRLIVLIMPLMIIFGMLSYVVTRLNIASNSTQVMTNTGSVVAGILDDHLKSAAKQLETVMSAEGFEEFVIALNTGKTVSADNGIIGALDAVCGYNPEFVSAWVISDSSGILAGSGGKYLAETEYGLKERGWYRKYISGGAYSGEYICTAPAPGLFNAEETVVTVIVPIMSEGSVYAFCGLEIKAESVFSAISKYTFNSGCYPIVACDSMIIYSPSSEEFSRKFSIEEQSLINIVSQTLPIAGKIDHYVSDKSGVVYYYIETSLVSGWETVVLFDSSAINGNIYKTFIQQLFILVCIEALKILFGINLLNRESAELDELCGCTEEIASGNLNYRMKVTEKTEVGYIASNVNKIAEIMQAKNAVISSFDTTDVLTGLKNRVCLYDYMDDVIHTREEGRSRFAVMFIDLDNFRWINETLGHNFGDAVLAAFGREIKNLSLPVFRFSGDEFIIIKEFDTDYQAVYDVIEKLHTIFAKPLEVMNDNIYIKFSIGVSIYPDDDVTLDMLLRNAEMALHRAKDSGKDRVAFYSNSHKSKDVYSRAAFARSLNEALENGEMFLNYQPIISTTTGNIHGFEVLLRWVSPEFGDVPPTEFIAVAEESGAIVKIGTWIFESACRTLKQINERLNPDIIMSVNVSAVQLKRENYIGHIKQVIDITQVNPKNIQIELTESTLVDFTNSKNNVIKELSDMGIALALDDFGTGYSSLNYLKNLPVKCLKIDKSFIDEINNNKKDYAITDSIIDLVHNLGIETIAEGIETVDQYNFLTDMKCDYIQGFLVSKPFDENAAVEFVERYNDLHKPDKLMLEANEKKLADEKKLRDIEASGKTEEEDAFTEDFIITK